MPIYEYKCFKCEFTIEKLQKLNANTTEICQKCNAEMKKIISSSNFQLKGNGWYKTDFKNNTKQNTSNEKD